VEADRLTTKSQEAVSAAVRRAAAGGHPEVAPVHLLLALLDQGDGITGPLLSAVGADPATVRTRAEALLAALPTASGANVAAPGLSRALLAVMNVAQTKAKEVGDEYVSTEHLLVGLADSGGDVADLLKQQQALPKALVEAFAKVRGGMRRVTTQDPESTYKALEKYGVDLTARARRGELDPVIGRDNEIRRVVQVLSRRTKNNPVLIGEPGVGKTAVVEEEGVNLAGIKRVIELENQVEALQSRLAELAAELDDARQSAVQAHQQAVASLRRDLVPVPKSALVVWKPSR
jgi:ATP-dependent Clp protease ATP-binding subunit ClpB